MRLSGRFKRDCRSVKVQKKLYPEISEAEEYYFGRGVPKNITMAYDLFLSKALKGNSKSMFYLGYMNKVGQVVSQDDGESFSWFNLAAQHGDWRARIFLLFMYMQDFGDGQKNYEYDKLLSFLYKYAVLGFSGEDHEEVFDYESEAANQVLIDWFVERAQFGDQEAQSLLGFIYEQTVIVWDCDRRGTAINLYKNAANQGHVYAQNSLAELYYRYYDNKSEALKWRAIAAENGHVIAQLHVCIKYFSLMQDIDTLNYYWCDEAYERGGFVTVDNLIGWIYENWGVEKQGECYYDDVIGSCVYYCAFEDGTDP